MIKSAAIAALLLASFVAGPAVAADDGFTAFWRSFAPAAAKDDKAALAGMIQLGPNLGDAGTTFAKFHAADLGPKARACLAKAKTTRDVDPQGSLSYEAFCGEIIYIFSKTPAGWKLTDLGAND